MTPHRTGRMVFLSMTALLLLACCVLFAYWQSLASAPVNSVRWLAGRYGVSPNRVRSLAYDLGVDPSQLNQYGPGDFPVNYFRERLKQTEEHQGQVTRAEVEDIVLGSELMCELDPDTLVYLFYSEKPTVPVLGPSALMLRFRFSDTMLESWDVPNLADSGLEWEKQTIKEKCMEQ